MNPRIKVTIATAGLFVFPACQSTTRVVSPDEPIHMSSRYDYTDLKSVTDKMVSSLVSNPPISIRGDRPVIIVYGVNNRTSEHIDTKMLTDKIRTTLLQTGKVRFVNESQRQSLEQEIEYQKGGMVASETRIQLGKQIGAEYLLTGTIGSMKREEGKGIRLKEESLRYYKFTMELTDVNTSIIEWTDEKEFAREESKPFIGW